MENQLSFGLALNWWLDKLASVEIKAFGRHGRFKKNRKIRPLASKYFDEKSMKSEFYLMNATEKYTSIVDFSRKSDKSENLDHLLEPRKDRKTRDWFNLFVSFGAFFSLFFWRTVG